MLLSIFSSLACFGQKRKESLIITWMDRTTFLMAAWPENKPSNITPQGEFWYLRTSVTPKIFFSPIYLHRPLLPRRQSCKRRQDTALLPPSALPLGGLVTPTHSCTCTHTHAHSRGTTRTTVSSSADNGNACDVLEPLEWAASTESSLRSQGHNTLCDVCVRARAMYDCVSVSVRAYSFLWVDD